MDFTFLIGTLMSLVAPRPSGPVAGAPSLVVIDRLDPTRCGGHDVRVRRTGKAAVDADFAAAMTLDAPRGLDFERHPDREPKRLRAFIDASSKAFGAARDRYLTIFRDAHATAQARVEAIARIAQLDHRYGELFETIEVPADVRRGPNGAEASVAMCDLIGEKAWTLHALGDDAATICRKTAIELKLGPGWWDDACR
jgi:hypothetical protein